MKTLTRSQAILLNAVVIGMGILPMALFWIFFGRAPDLDVAEVKEMFRPMSLFEQWLAVIVAFGIKPVYMLLASALVLWLWRQRAVDLAALRWGLIWFLGGEAACAINFLFFAGHCDPWEFAHNYGMAAGFSLVTYALIEGFDVRLLKLSPPKERCAALSLCRDCIKYDAVPCGLQRVFTMLIPALALLAMLPLCAELQIISYNSEIFGSLYNYSHPIADQLFELRYCPALAFLLLAASWLVLMFKRQAPVPPSKVLFAAAVGPLSFGLLRLFFVSTFSDKLVWCDVWEEATELLFILAAGIVLWIFRSALFVPSDTFDPAKSIV